MGYGHIASNCPSKRNMFVHNGIVMSENDSDSPRHSSPSRASSEHESESPLEGDLFTSAKRKKGYALFSAAFALPAFEKNAVAFLKLF